MPATDGAECAETASRAASSGEVERRGTEATPCCEVHADTIGSGGARLLSRNICGDHARAGRADCGLRRVIPFRYRTTVVSGYGGSDSMRAELEIHWDGNGPGLAEHRLSVSALTTPLNLLLAAVRRIATNLAIEATDSERGARGGRFARFAENIDIQLSTVEQGCLHLTTEVVFPDPDDQLSLFANVDDLAGRTLKELVEAIDSESKGRARSAPVRKFLMSMEGIVSSHSYRASAGGTLLAHATIGEPTLLAEPTLGSYMVVYEGQVSGVLFEPRPEIRLRNEGQSFRVRAALADVEKALELRGRDVVVYAGKTETGIPSLLQLKPLAEAQVVPNQELRREHLLTRWRPLLERLAQ